MNDGEGLKKLDENSDCSAAFTCVRRSITVPAWNKRMVIILRTGVWELCLWRSDVEQV
jgi:hypothetical protein